MHRFLTYLLISIITVKSYGQIKDTISVPTQHPALLQPKDTISANDESASKDILGIHDSLTAKHIQFKQFIIPAVLIGYGVIGLESDQLKSWNFNISSEVQEDIDQKITVDDFSQYIPMASVYALNGMGIKGKHDFKDRTIIIATSYLMLSATVFGLKTWTKVERPDGSSNNSFPSGHTATAFAGAEFLWQEYKDQSVWYGIAGYTIASATGIFRIVNNRHWLTDVAAGAGIGILCTKVAYLIYPYVKDKLFKSSEHKVTSLIVPFYNGSQMGCSFVARF